MRNKTKYIVGGLLIALVVFILFATVSSKNITYYYTPAEVLQFPQNFADRKIRVMGLVEPGSVQWIPQGPELRFRISEDRISYLRVVYRGAKPDMFGENQGIIVEGSMDDPSVFEASLLLVKHNEQYTVEEHKKDRSDYYKTLQN